MLFPSVEDVFSTSDKRESASPVAPRCPSRIFNKSSRHPRSKDDAPRAPAVRKQDIPIILQKLVKMIALSKDATLGDSSDGLRSDPDNCAVVFDMDALRAAIAAARDAYPAHWVHCLAIKCCPLAFVIQELVGAGFGVEAASFVELYMALAHGCPPKLAVFDSPAKTGEELEMALRSGALINANSLDELDRIECIIRRQTSGAEVTSRVGIRLNPLVGAGAISALSTAVPTSKFGVPVTPKNVSSVVDAFRKWPWLVGLHVHVGSQGCSLDQLAQGVALLCEVADLVDSELGKGRVALLDIGGGLPVNYRSADVTPTFRDHAAILRRKAPKLFENTDRVVITEFGRSIVAKAAITVSRVEYVRHNVLSDREPEDGPQGTTGASNATALPGSSESQGCQSREPIVSPIHQTLVTHMGADMFVRSAYSPGNFQHQFSVHGTNGEILTGPLCRTEIAGPLCFEGDYVARGASLPHVSAGDLVVAHDTGANTFSLFSRHCSRQAPAFYGYALDEDGELSLRLMKKKESVRDVARFWGASV